MSRAASAFGRLEVAFTLKSQTDDGQTLLPTLAPSHPSTLATPQPRTCELIPDYPPACSHAPGFTASACTLRAQHKHLKTALLVMTQAVTRVTALPIAACSSRVDKLSHFRLHVKCLSMLYRALMCASNPLCLPLLLRGTYR